MLFLSRHKKSRQKKGAPQTPGGLGPRHLTLSRKDGRSKGAELLPPPDAHCGTRPHPVPASPGHSSQEGILVITVWLYDVNMKVPSLPDPRISIRPPSTPAGPPRPTDGPNPVGGGTRLVARESHTTALMALSDASREFQGRRQSGEFCNKAYCLNPNIRR